MRISANLGAGFTTLFYTGSMVWTFVQATPRRNETWFSHVTTPLEQLSIKASVPFSSVNLVIDLYILILPIVAVAKLQMASRRRIGIILVFLTGLL